MNNRHVLDERHTLQNVVAYTQMQPSTLTEMAALITGGRKLSRPGTWQCMVKQLASTQQIRA